MGESNRFEIIGRIVEPKPSRASGRALNSKAMKQETLTREDFQEIGVNLDDEKFELMKTYYMATGDSKVEFLKHCSLGMYDGNDDFWDYLIESITARVFELLRQISVNEVRIIDTADSLLNVVDNLNKIKKECLSTVALNLADSSLRVLGDVLVGYGSKLDIIIKKAQKHVDLTDEEIDYLIEVVEGKKVF